MDGDPPFPDGQGLGPLVGVVTPLEGDVVDACSDHRREHEQWKQVTDQPVFELPGSGQLTGEVEADQHR